MEGRHMINAEHFARAKVLCGQFLTGNWTNRDAIDTSVLSGGYVNILILCELKENYRDEKSRPHKVIVRILRTMTDYVVSLGEAGEAIAIDAIAKNGFGPKLLGVFAGGRIEEFIDSRYLTHDEVKNVNVLKVIARNVAKYHSLDIPIRQDENHFTKLCVDFVSREAQKLRDWSRSYNVTQLSGNVKEILKKILKMDFASEQSWVLTQLSKIKSRVICLSHNDLYYSNIIVKKSMNVSSLKDDDIMIIDIEVASTYYRGLDIGTFLQEIAFDNTDTSHPVFIGQVPEVLEHEFIKEYLKEWISLNPDKYDPDLDNFYNLLLESRLLSLMMRIQIYLWLMNEFIKCPEQFPEPLFNAFRERMPLDEARKKQVEIMLKDRSLL